MNYKIIGGPLDGQTHDIQPHQESGTVLVIEGRRIAIRKETVFNVTFYVDPNQTSAQVAQRLLAAYPDQVANLPLDSQEPIPHA